ncbi:MAG: glycosyltransferase [Rhodoblastus sp.]|nr:glycosyltransferase [Rhodoblastus sp.]MCO5087950.1 glycosyltransferase [Methylobacteriaceae bacterium]
MVAIGASFLLLVGRFLYDELRGVGDGSAAVPPLAETDLPHVVLQIPVFNEPRVVEGALRAAVALDWPRDKLHIQLLDDSTDETTERAAAIIAELRAAGNDVAHVRREDRSGFKAGACAAGLALNDAPFVAMLDVDFRPPADWLRKAIPVIVSDPKAGFVQARCEFANYRKNWLTRVQGLILDAHFMIEQRTRANLGWLFQFNGTGGIWRRAAIDSVGGWLDYSLTEDLDLTIRTALAGWHGRFISQPAIPGQMPEGMRDWRRQQRRWSNGFIQVAQRTIGPLWNAPWSLGNRISSIALVLHQVFFPLCAGAIIFTILGIVARGFAVAPYAPLFVFIFVMVAAVVLGMTMPPYLALKRGSVWRYFATMAMLPPLFIYLAVANAPKILQTARGRQEHFKRTPKKEH